MSACLGTYYLAQNDLEQAESILQGVLDTIEAHRQAYHYASISLARLRARQNRFEEAQNWLDNAQLPNQYARMYCDKMCARAEVEQRAFHHGSGDETRAQNALEAAREVVESEGTAFQSKWLAKLGLSPV
jgi:tetratricopeptide (TPR) repeat protein